MRTLDITSKGYIEINDFITPSQLDELKDFTFRNIEKFQGKNFRLYEDSFKNTVIEGEAYDKCTACCEEIIDAYTKDGIDFVIDVCNDSSLLEKKSGLFAMKEDMEKMMDDFDIGMEEDEMGTDEFGSDNDDAILL